MSPENLGQGPSAVLWPNVQAEPRSGCAGSPCKQRNGALLRHLRTTQQRNTFIRSTHWLVEQSVPADLSPFRSPGEIAAAMPYQLHLLDTSQTYQPHGKQGITALTANTHCTKSCSLCFSAVAFDNGLWLNRLWKVTRVVVVSGHPVSALYTPATTCALEFESQLCKLQFCDL